MRARAKQVQMRGEDEDGAFAYADENEILSFFESIDKYGL